MKQEFHTIHSEITSLKPKVQTEFDRVRAEMVEQRDVMKNMHTSMHEMHAQIKLLTNLLMAGNSKSFGDTSLDSDSNDVISLSDRIENNCIESTCNDSRDYYRPLTSEDTLSETAFEEGYLENTDRQTTSSPVNQVLHPPLQRSPAHNEGTTVPKETQPTKPNSIDKTVDKSLSQISSNSFKIRTSNKSDPWSATPPNAAVNPGSFHNVTDNDEIDIYEYSL
jgi:hypothetical protein